MKTIVAFLISFFIISLAHAEDDANEPDAGGDDCYNRVSKTCNGKHPGKDMGDKVYRDCINGGLDWCDTNEPTGLTTGLFPEIDSDGRFSVKNSRGENKNPSEVHIHIHLDKLLSE